MKDPQIVVSLLILAALVIGGFALVFWGRMPHWLDDRGEVGGGDPAPDADGDGGDGNGADGDGDGDEGDGDSDGEDEDGADGDGADALGDAGKQALDRMKAERNAARKEARQLRRDLAAATAPKPAEGDAPDPEALKEQGRREALEQVNGRILRSEVRAAAAGKLTDPADALLYLDLTQFEVDDDGNVDADELADAIDELITSKPYLSVSAQGGNSRFRGGADGGTRKGSKPPTLDEQIAAAQKDGNARLLISLQNQKLAELHGSS